MSAPNPPTDVGDFSRQPAPARPTGLASPPATTSPASTHPGEAERIRLEKEIADAKEKESPQERYKKALAEVKCTPEKAAEILDAMLSQGFYEEDFDVIPGRLRVRLRTRSLRDTQRIQEALEERRPVFQDSQSQLVNEMLLAASIVNLGKETYRHPERSATPQSVEELFAERWTKLRQVSDIIVPILFERRVSLDEKLRVVFREGALPNF